MKWEGNRESDNVEDRRGAGGGFGGKSVGLGTVAIALVVSTMAVWSYRARGRRR